jgi:hypothetical protein
VGNWKTAADRLISNDLLFSGTHSEKDASGKLKSGSSATDLGGSKPVNSAAPPMGIQRQYRPSPGALDDLVEALYRLLAEMPSESSTTSPPDGDLHSGPAGVRNVS